MRFTAAEITGQNAAWQSGRRRNRATARATRLLGSAGCKLLLLTQKHKGLPIRSRIADACAHIALRFGQAGGATRAAPSADGLAALQFKAFPVLTRRRGTLQRQCNRQFVGTLVGLLNAKHHA
jgi:hypothetical protein